MSTGSTGGPPGAVDLPPPKSPAPKKRAGRPRKTEKDGNGNAPATPVTPSSTSSGGSSSSASGLSSSTPSMPTKPAIKKSRTDTPAAKQKKSLQFSLDTTASGASNNNDDSLLFGEDSNDPLEKVQLPGSVGEEDLSDEDDLEEDQPSKNKKSKPNEIDDSNEVVYETLTEAEQAQIEEEEKEEEEKEQRTKSVLKEFSEDQMQRYEYYRRSSLQKGSVKKIMQGIAGVPISQQTAIVMAGITKVYVGEIVETARAIMDEWKEPPGPLRPRHLVEAYRRLQRDGIAPPLTKFPAKLLQKRG